MTGPNEYDSLGSIPSFEEDSTTAKGLSEIYEKFLDADSALKEEDLKRALGSGAHGVSDLLDLGSETLLMIPGVEVYMRIKGDEIPDFECMREIEKKAATIILLIEDLGKKLMEMDTDNDGTITLTDANIGAIKVGASFLIEAMNDLMAESGMEEDGKITIEVMKMEVEKQVKKLKLDKKKEIKLDTFKPIFEKAVEASKLSTTVKKGYKFLQKIFKSCRGNGGG